jgi:bifunctional UDP-N-acetylglucosamine pyrophosphorylase/glucosamine-1-phosphate N-acetyltransferase
LRGATCVGSGCEIGPATTLADATVGDRAQVRYALVERALVPNDAVIGPFVHVIGT